MCTNQHFPNHLWSEGGGERRERAGRGEGQIGDEEGTDGKAEVSTDA